MTSIKIYDAEYKFMSLLWDKAPINSSEAVKVAKNKLGWSKSTTYTVIRRLCERGAIENKNAVIRVLLEREQVMRNETEEHIEKVYAGSLKLFFTAFLQKEKLSPEELSELRKIVEQNSDKEK